MKRENYFAGDDRTMRQRMLAGDYYIADDPERRERIIAACLDVIAESGVAGTSHRKVAAETARGITATRMPPSL